VNTWEIKDKEVKKQEKKNKRKSSAQSGFVGQRESCGTTVRGHQPVQHELKKCKGKNLIGPWRGGKGRRKHIIQNWGLKVVADQVSTEK